MNDIIKDDLPFDYDFVVRSNMKITAIFHPNNTSANPRHVVVFADSSNKIIEVKYVEDGANVTEPATLPGLPPFAKYAETKWLTSSNVSSLNGINSNRVYFLQYDEDTTTQFNVTVNGGSGDGSYLYNSVVTVTPDAAPANQVFSHREDSNGNLLSTKQNYKFTVLGHVSIQAVFASTPENLGAIISMSDVLNLRSGYVSYKGQIDLPAGYTLVEYGFIFSRSSDVLTLDSLGATIVPSNVHNGQTGEFLRSFPESTFNSVRAYMMVKNASDVEEVVYSDNNYKSYSQLNMIKNYTNATNSSSYTTSQKVRELVSDTEITLVTSRTSVQSTSWMPKSALVIAATTSIDGYVIYNFAQVVNSVSFDIGYWNVDAQNATTQAVIQQYVNGSWELLLDFQSQIKVGAYTNISVSVNSSQIRFYTKSSVTANTARVVLDNVKAFNNSYPKAHEVIYNNSSFNTQFVTNESLIIQDSPTQIGYSFAGWYTDAALTQSYNVSTPVIQSMKLYAKWSINQYTITFDSVGGTSVNPITQNYNTAVVAPANPTKEGYTFAGWSQSIPGNMPDGNLTLTAQWTINQYTITFDSNDGSVVSPIIQNFGTSVVKPTDPTRDGFLFKGWFTDDTSFSNEYVFTTMPASNQTVYAKWDEVSGIEYNVIFDISGGTSGSIDSQVVPENGTATKPVDPTRTGYRFVEWRLSGNPFNFATPITTHVTLVAEWIEQVTVTFNVDGGTAVASQVIDFGTKATQPASPTKAGGYTFGGWFTTSAKDASFNFANAITINTTVYAKWNPAVYATDLFISEYVEGSASNKYIEIYNGTGQNVDLTNYRLALYANGNTTATTTTLTGTLAHNAVIVLKNSGAVLTLPNGVTAIVNAQVNFNGDDAIALQKNISSVWTNIDIIGQIGFDPGTNWSGNGVSTVDKTLVRNSNVLVGDNDGTNVFDPSLQWTQFPIDTASNLGTHNANVSNPLHPLQTLQLQL